MDCIALLGIAQRTIYVAWQYVKPFRKPQKRFPTAIKTIGDHIQVERFEKGFTRRQLASRLGIDVSVLANWEEDGRVPTADESKLLSELLGTIAFPVVNPP